MECPFSCGFKAESEYGMLLHMEIQHPEDDNVSPFVIQAETATHAIHDVVQQERRRSSGEREPEDEDFVSCPVEGCGEQILLTELEGHVDMHGEEGDLSASTTPEPDPEHITSSNAREPATMAKRVKLSPDYEDSRAEKNQKRGFGTKLSHALRNLEDVDIEVHDREERAGKSNHRKGNAGGGNAQTAKSAWGKILKMPEMSGGKGGTRRRSRSPARNSTASPRKAVVKRLGKAELGPHANEKQMPEWLVKLLQENDGKLVTTNQLDRGGKTRRSRVTPNMAADIIPIIVHLLDLDPGVAYAYVCNPAVRHVSKLMKEGGFCGYRNIQMMSSYIVGAQSQGHGIFDSKIPTIFEIQEYVETAWDNGINSQGRIETGGVRGTRKYIGTSEAQAMFLLLGIPCDAQAFKTRKQPTLQLAYDLLFQFVESYFTSGCTSYDPKIRPTNLPPIYFQHPGHSMTIVGFQKSNDGSRELLVFDPMFHDSPMVLRLADALKGNGDGVSERVSLRKAEELLRAYRRGSKYLRKYGEFEVLRLSSPVVGAGEGLS